MTDSPLPQTDDERYDYEHVRRRPWVFRRRSPASPSKSGNRLAGAVAIGSLLLQLLAIAWMGGRLEQRVTGHDKELGEQAADIKDINRNVGTQSNSLAVANATYAEILRRLSAGDERATRIEAKIDELGRNRN